MNELKLESICLPPDVCLHPKLSVYTDLKLLFPPLHRRKHSTVGLALPWFAFAHAITEGWKW